MWKKSKRILLCILALMLLLSMAKSEQLFVQADMESTEKVQTKDVKNRSQRQEENSDEKGQEESTDKKEEASTKATQKTEETIKEDKKNLEILEMSSSVVYVPPCTDPSKPYMLIVDDDTQVAFYLKILFGEDYNVINKYSAESALAALETVEPDIILSDVVMGEMSGYEFCRNLKESRLHCHIPVI